MRIDLPLSNTVWGDTHAGSFTMTHSHQGSVMSVRRVSPLLGAVLLLVALLLTPVAPAGAAAGGQVYVLHGLPGLVADVQIDGRSTMKDVKQGTIVGPIAVSAGTHQIALVATGQAPLRGTVKVGSRGSVDVVAHLPADLGGKAMLTAFPNDLAAVGPGKSRLTVAHTAQVPPADIRIDGKPLLRNVANSEVLTLEVPQLTYGVDIVPTGTTGPVVFGPVDLAVKAGSLTRVYAFGSPAEGTMNVLVHRLPLSQQGSAIPASVQTGTGGQSAALLAARR